MSCDTFTITGDSETVSLSIPETGTWLEDRKIKTFNFFTDAALVSDDGKEVEKITISNYDDSSTLNLTDVRAYEYFTTQTHGTHLAGNTWKGQGFKIGYMSPNENYYITQLRLYLKRIGTISNCTVSIRSSLTGADLCSGTIMGSSVSTDNYEWKTFIMDTELEVTPDTTYYIIARIDTDNFPLDRMRWGSDVSAGYNGGIGYNSTTAGASWTISTYDRDFYVDGYPKNIFSIMKRIDNMMENGEQITLSGFNNSFFDTTWYIEDFNYKVVAPLSGVVQWSLTLEKA